MEETGISRRGLFGGLGAGLAAGVTSAQQDPFRDHSRVPGMDELRTVTEFEAVAFAKLPRETWTYTAYGVEGEYTLRRNREAFDWVELLPGGAVETSAINTATTILGTPMKFPIFVSPSAAHGALFADGEVATHKGASAASETPMIISVNASFPVDKVIAGGTSPAWWQFYPQQDLEVARDQLEKAVAAGAKAIVMTTDQQASYYERSLHDRHLSDATSRGGATGAGGRPGAARPPAPPSNPYRVPSNRLWYTWQYADEIRKLVKVPLIAKGVLTAEDAKEFVKRGYDGIYVSNHGGRSMDYDPATLEVLAEVVDAVPRVPVLFDGGIRCGADIFKALALGAKAVCLGRTIRWGLAAYGPAGVQRVLEILQRELLLAMAQTGRRDLASIDRSVIRTRFT